MRKSFAYIAITFVILQFTFGFFFFPNDKSGEFFGGVEKVEAATFEEDKAAGFAFADSLMDINGKPLFSKDSNGQPIDSLERRNVASAKTSELQLGIVNPKIQDLQRASDVSKLDLNTSATYRDSLLAKDQIAFDKLDLTAQQALEQDWANKTPAEKLASAKNEALAALKNDPTANIQKTNEERGFWGTMTQLANTLMDPVGWCMGIWTAITMAIVMPILGFLLVVMSYIMEVIMNFSINTASYRNGEPIGNAIIFGWSFVRDLLNITLIFMLVWSAIKTIIGENSSIDNGVIGKVIMAGVLVNFSLLFTQMIIDFFNIFAMAIITSIKTTMSNGTSGLSQDQLGGPMNLGSYMFNIFFSDYYQSVAEWNTKKLFGPGALFTAYIEIAMICTAIYVYFRVAKIFFVRGLVFIFCMITSPIMFFGFVAPKLEGYRKKWWENLINSSLTAPIFLICVYLVVKIMSSKDFTNVLKGGLTNQGDTLKIVAIIKPEAMVYFFMIFALLYAAVYVTEEYSSSLGNAIWEQGLEIVKKGISLIVSTAMAVATGGAALGAKGAIATLNNKALLATAGGTGSEAEAARATLAAAKNKYENPMGAWKNTFAATSKITGLLGAKASNPFGDYGKGRKWEAGQEIYQPGFLGAPVYARSYLGMEAPKSKEEKAELKIKAQEEIRDNSRKYVSGEAQKYAGREVADSRENSNQSATNFKTIQDGIVTSAERTINDKMDELEKNVEFISLKESMATDEKKIADLRIEIAKMEENQKLVYDPSRAVDMLNRRNAIETADTENAIRQKEIKTRITNATGLNEKYVEVNRNGKINVKTKDYTETVLDDLGKLNVEGKDLNDAVSRQITGKSWADVERLKETNKDEYEKVQSLIKAKKAHEQMKTDKAEYEKVQSFINAKADAIQRFGNTHAAAGMRKALLGKTSQEKALDVLRDALAEGTKDKKEEKPKEEKPKEEKK